VSTVLGLIHGCIRVIKEAVTMVTGAADGNTKACNYPFGRFYYAALCMENTAFTRRADVEILYIESGLNLRR
jgi:hypothetical protein